jgi:tRNA threonylcarbamoyladenosine biosynthesis protein TsaE
LLGTHALAGADDTVELGRRLGDALRPGDLVILSGPLGAGKTTLTRGIGEAMNVRGAVTSPTFVIARVHPGAVPLVHVDAYRLSSLDELDDLDLDADLAASVVVVEWGEGLVEGLADEHLLVRLDRGSSDVGSADTRTAEVTHFGAPSPSR